MPSHPSKQRYFLFCIQRAHRRVLTPLRPARTPVLSSEILISLSPAKPEECKLLPSVLLPQVYLPKMLPSEEVCLWAQWCNYTLVLEGQVSTFSK